MELRSSQWLLRPMAGSDHAEVFCGLSHPDVTRHYGVCFETLEASREQMTWYAELVRSGTGIWWSIRSAEEETFLGAIGLNDIEMVHRRGELGFWLLPDHWRKGIMGQVLPLVIDHAFRSIGLHRIQAQVETGNIASARVLQRAGFVQEGTLRECEWKDGHPISLDLYALLNMDTLER